MLSNSFDYHSRFLFITRKQNLCCKCSSGALFFAPPLTFLSLNSAHEHAGRSLNTALSVIITPSKVDNSREAL
jgi:hypothetical protein